MVSIGTFILLIFSSTSIAAGVDEIITYSECWSPYNSAGHCVRLIDCPEFIKLLQQASSSSNAKDIKLLQNSQCGVDNQQTDAAKRTLVCCPDQSTNNTQPEISISNILPKPAGVDGSTSYFQCWSPYNNAGHCVRLGDCPEFINMLQQATSASNQEDIKLLQKSQCGEDNTQTDIVNKVLVCCPDQFWNNSMPEDSDILPKPGKCGAVLSNRIVGGTETMINEFPWMALINYKNTTNQFEFLCGGSLINSRYVVTAAHCVKNREIPSTWELHSVRLGEWNKTTNPDCVTDISGKLECAPPHLDIMIESTIAHPNYQHDSENQFFDIALIRLEKQVVSSFFVSPICLPDALALRNKDFTNVAMDVAGFGATGSAAASDLKLKVTVKVWNLTDCQKLYDPRRSIDRSFQLCAGGQDGIDTCRGDSGGPLMVMENIEHRDIYFLAGVVAYGPKPCGTTGWPGVYTRVGSFVDWIKRNLKP